MFELFYQLLYHQNSQLFLGLDTLHKPQLNPAAAALRRADDGATGCQELQPFVFGKNI
jgi:hypothetical protein